MAVLIQENGSGHNHNNARNGTYNSEVRAKTLICTVVIKYKTVNLGIKSRLYSSHSTASHVESRTTN